jgi:tRNA(Ser,Leu) C12 N-acetylase TAN1
VSDAGPEAPTWNLLVTSLEGQRDALRAELRPLVRLRRSGYPNVLIAAVPDPGAVLEQLRAAYETSAGLRASLGKAIPIERRFHFAGAPAFVDAVERELEPSLARLEGATFFVRVVRRGLRGALGTTDAEREIGARVVRALEARGCPPRVRFDDPDLIVLVETIRDEAGLALLPRTLRAAFPFVRVR